MITVNDIFKFLNDRFPTDTACDFDNVGLLIGSGKTPVKKAVVSLDCMLDTVSFAKSIGAELIVTHHPVIFNGLKSVLSDSAVYEAIASGISVISMHTNLDVGSGGVNDTLCKLLGLGEITEYIAEDGYKLKCGSINATEPEDFAKFLKDTLGTVVRFTKGTRPIERVLVCSGSGGGYLYDAIKGGFDALVTADVKHSILVDAANAGFSIFDAGHLATEDIIVFPLCEMLSDSFTDVQFTEYHTDNICDI